MPYVGMIWVPPTHNASDRAQPTACEEQGIARTQSPTNKNDALELPTFGVIVEVSSSSVQWKSLTLGESPSWSWLTPMPGKYEADTLFNRGCCPEKSGNPWKKKWSLWQAMSKVSDCLPQSVSRQALMNSGNQATEEQSRPYLDKAHVLASQVPGQLSKGYEITFSQDKILWWGGLLLTFNKCHIQ